MEQETIIKTVEVIGMVLVCIAGLVFLYKMYKES